MYWSSKELLESNNLLAGWSGFELRSTPLQSKKITGLTDDQITDQLVLRGCKVRRHVGRLVANILLSRLDPSPSLAPYRDIAMLALFPFFT